MERTPKISVLMAVYNTPFTLVKRAIDSVLGQTYQDFKLTIIDDGSNNDPQSRILRYAVQHENKISYLRHKNRGQSLSINQGVLSSKSDYITILDADDEYTPNHLSGCLQEMQDTDLIASTTLTIVDDESDCYVPDKHNKTQLIHVDECILFATLFGKREVFEAIPFQDFYAADSHFFEEAAKQFRVKKTDLRTYIYYRNIPGSICDLLKKENLQ